MKRILMLVMASFAVAVAALAATPPQYVNYQSILRDASGNALSGTYGMTFSFYDAPSGGNLLLADAHLASGTGAVTVDNGLFNVPLGGGSLTPGAETAIAGVFASHSEVYLELQVGSETLSPRVPVRSAAFAQNAHALDGNPITAFALASHTHDAADIVTGTLPAARGGTGLADPGPSGNVLTSNGTTWTSVALPSSWAPPANALGWLHDDGSGAFAWTMPTYSDVGAMQSVPPGAAGNVLTSNGAGWTSAFPAGDATKLPLAGGTISGAIVTPPDSSFANFVQGAVDTSLGVCGLWFRDTIFSGLHDPQFRLGYNIDGAVAGQMFYQALEGNYYDDSIGQTWSEYYLERRNTDGSMYRPFGVGTYDDHADSFFNVDGLYINSREGIAALAIGSGFIQVAPGNRLYFTANDFTGIVQRNSSGGQTGLAKLTSSDRWLISPDNAPIDLMGTVSLLDGSNNRWTFSPSGAVTTISYLPNGGSASNYFSFGYTLGNAQFQLLGIGDSNQIIAPNGSLRIYAKDAATPVIIGSNSSNIWVIGNALTVGSLTASGTIKGASFAATSEPPIFPNNADAIIGGLTVGQFYRTGGDPDVLCIVHVAAAASRKTEQPPDKPSTSAGASSNSATESAASLAPSVDADGNVYSKSFRPSNPEFATIMEVNTPVETGDVLAARRKKPGQLHLASSAYDPAVVGIVAGKPGVILGACKQPCQASQQGLANGSVFQAPVVLSGIALCKVDAGQGQISVGDLLVTSSTPGYAMAAQNPTPGTVVAKALEPLDSGRGLIKVLVMLR